MPSFSKMLSKGKQNVTKFFNSTLPNATRSGVRFFNSTLVPVARQIHSVGKAITNEVSSNESIPDKVRQRAKKVSDFSDLGLSRLENVQGSVNRLSKNLGLD